MNQTREENSMCDIIMEGVSGQVTEVIEHILHHISDVGLHYTMSRREAEAKSARNIRRLQQQQRDWEERIDQALEMMPDRRLPKDKLVSTLQEDEKRLAQLTDELDVMALRPSSTKEIWIPSVNNRMKLWIRISMSERQRCTR